MNSPTNEVYPLIFALLLPNIGGWILALLAMDSVTNWYPGLNKPSWAPPTYLFGPIWTILYSAMGVASFLIWKQGGFKGESGIALGIYSIQLVLNWAWTPIFFMLHQIQWGLIEIIVLTIAATICALYFLKENKVSGLLMMPYLVWLGIATALNYSIWSKN